MDPYALAKRLKDQHHWDVELQAFGFSNRFLLLWKGADNSAFFSEFSAIESIFPGITLSFISGFAEGDALALTYFFRAPDTSSQVIFRFLIERANPDRLYETRSIASRFPVARIYENEIAALFGTRFLDADYSYTLLPTEENEFSMRSVESLSVHHGEYL